MIKLCRAFIHTLAACPRQPAAASLRHEMHPTAAAAFNQQQQQLETSRPSLAPIHRRRFWTHDETEKLKHLLASSPLPISWSLISRHFPNRSRRDVYRKWLYTLDPCVFVSSKEVKCLIILFSDRNIRRGEWTLEEDQMLQMWVLSMGKPHKWAAIARNMANGRTPVQCRLRWYDIKAEARGRWDREETERLLMGQRVFPHQWERIARQYVKTRTARQCQHRFRILCR